MNGRRWLTVVSVTAGLLWLPALAWAHPLGNFTTNTYAGIVVRPDAVAVDYVVDLAEIPALQAVQRIDANGDGALGRTEAPAYRDTECGRLAQGLSLTIDGRAVPLSVDGGAVSLLPGEAGLSTLRLECAFEGDTAGTADAILFNDRNFADRAGWREITAAGDRVTLERSGVPSASISRRLTAYPQDRLGSPLNVRRAELDVRPGGPGRSREDAASGTESAAVVRTLDRFSRAFTDLVAQRDLTAAFALAATAIATVLGAVHALAPGHGKTLMAAYVLSRRGTERQALGLGLTVAVTHTLGVLLLGVVITATELATPERVYPWLGLASGLFFCAVGVLLLRRSLAGRHPAEHYHDEPALTWRGLAAPGLAGGMVPSPSALVVLLGGVALDRAWFGVLLVLAYGAGMASALVGGGWLLLRAHVRLERGARMSPRLLRGLPVGTACVVILGGLVVAARSVALV